VLTDLELQVGQRAIAETDPNGPTLVLDRAAWLLEQAETNPDVMQALVQRPLEVIQAANLDLWTMLKLALDLPGATDLEVIDVLRGQLNRAQRRRDLEACCGNCGVEYCRTNP
jgi:hypothetical protein